MSNGGDCRGKAQTLEWLASRLRCGRVLPLVHFSAEQWRTQRDAILAQVMASPFADAAMIVRSSADGEDGAYSSQAGRFLSVAEVCGHQAMAAAIDQVVASYVGVPGDHRVLVQPMLRGVVASGVMFTRDPASGAGYVVINYQEGDDTAAVTGGRNADLLVFRCWRGQAQDCEGMIGRLLALDRELEDLYANQALDVEFGWTGDGLPVVFQVRPLVLKRRAEISDEEQTRVLDAIAAKVEASLKPMPFLCGHRTVFGVMPDWNPAEIIGVRPRPLSMSLYRDLITDSVWAYQRHNYGYRNMRSFPLMVDFHGLPYIDVRVSFNSFVPGDIESGLADRLVNHYIDRLVAAPALHDKIEFEIVLSCYSFDLPQRLENLPAHKFDQADREAIADSLRQLTNRIIDRHNGLWLKDSERIEELVRRHRVVMEADMDVVSRIYWLLEDCKRYGTLPFAGLARAGFIASQILKSLVAVGVFSAEDCGHFMSGLDTVSATMWRDLGLLRRDEFLRKYGHLRPGTYDIMSPRYDAAPDRYFDWSAEPSPVAEMPKFSLSLAQMRAIEKLLRDHGLKQDVVGLFDFLEAGIRGREYAKFIFTRSLSDSLELLELLGQQHGFSVDDMTYADIGCIRRLYAGSENAAEVLAESIAQGRERYRMTSQLSLPSLITEADQVWRFHQPPTEPNFVTLGNVVAEVRAADPEADLTGGIILLPNADPGYDWIFTRNIAGFVTAYGGANSHMAVRAGELELPAVIGAGEARYEQWSQARRLRLDCLNRQVQILQ